MLHPPSRIKIEVEGATLTVPEFMHSLAYLARVYKVGEVSPIEQMLTINIDEAYGWLDTHIGDQQYGDIQVYDVTWAATKPPTLLRTLPSRRRQR
ncbi:hypothetical protein [Nonomuraea ceibae]|uniref:hypothetical protein n=1 Tax=Nonomuraea ceibae TaxID=1935170 RepID=UPI001C5CE0E5|nr:hypothetical protein [Nonomuraea ceibae]